MAAVVVDPRDAINSILEWIGFDDDDDRESILDEAFEVWEDIYSLQTKDIESLVKDFARHTGDDKIVFGLKHTNN
jgi:hypothetical protein